MVKAFLYGFIASVFLCGLLWFFVGRTNYGSIEQTAEQVQQSYREAQHSISSVRARYDQIASTVARLDTQSAEIESGSIILAETGRQLTSQSTGIKSGINNVKISIDRIENRNREIVSIIGELRKTNESFYKSNQKYEETN